MSSTQFKLAADGSILEVPENADLLRLVEEAKTLNPRQLLEIAGRLRTVRTQTTLADHLAMVGLAGVATHPPIIAAIQNIEDTEVGWSLFGDVWKAVVQVFGGSPAGGSGSSSSSSSASGYGSTAPSGCDIKCVTPLFGGGLMVEKCKGDKQWRVIGLCYGSSF
jgi:hypothetical protein